MIHKPTDDFTLIIYNSPKPPRFIKINKKLINLLVISIPILLVLSLFFSLSSSVYMKTKLENVKSKEPKIIASLKTERDELRSELKRLESNVKELTTKISMGSSNLASATLDLFATPLGYTDETDLSKVKLENISTNIKDNDLEFRFDLLNNLENGEKLAGYVTIIQFSENQMQVYPNYELTIENNRLIYSKGESFTVSRFRPVIAPFKKPDGLNAWYKIFIFSRTGNLMAYKEAGPYQVN